MNKWRIYFLRGNIDLCDDAQYGKPMMQDLTKVICFLLIKGYLVHARSFTVTLRL
jgi:hypothetical protein